MDQKTMTLKCFRCGRQQLVLDMVMDASGKGMVCRPCAGLKPKGGTEEPQTISSIREQFARPKTAKQSSGKFACTNCKFRFSSSKAFDQISCPYCGSRRVAKPEEVSADALIRDASRTDYDF
jgi:DNA-directed RNA polymerase subunit RPC12/RpoP